MKKFSAVCPALFAAIVLCTTVSCAVTGALFDGVEAAGNASGNKILSAVGKAGSSVSKAAETITPEQEYYIGRAVAATLLGSYELYGNQKATLYVNEVCGVLTANSSRPELFNGYHVAILDSEQINAFATSGGHILVTRGLLKCTDSEDALAAVLAHEIAHIQLMHSIKAIKTSRISDALMATAGAAMTVSGNETLQDLAGTLDESVNEIVSTMVNTGYSQSQEYDADETALEIMYAAGYNPRAMTQMLTLLETRQPGSSGGFASTHPSAQNRLKKVEKKLEKYPDVNVPSARQKRYAASEIAK